MMNDMRSPEPTRSVADSMPPVIAQVFEHECQEEGPPCEGHVGQSTLIDDGDHAQEYPAEHPPEEDTANADGDIRESIAKIIFAPNPRSRHQHHLERDEEQKEQLPERYRIDDRRIRHALSPVWQAKPPAWRDPQSVFDFLATRNQQMKGL